MTTASSNTRRSYISLACFLAISCLLLMTGCGKQDPLMKDKNVQAMNCANQLSMVANAKKLWAEQNNKTPNDTPTMEDITPFVRGAIACPGGGTYTIGKVADLPTCSIPEHQAEFVKKVQNTPAPTQ
jgi:hypothetical protein